MADPLLPSFQSRTPSSGEREKEREREVELSLERGLARLKISPFADFDKLGSYVTVGKTISAHSGIRKVYK